MANISYGIKRFQPKMWAIGFRQEDGGCFVEFSHAETGKEAIALAFRGKVGKLKITRVLSEAEMSQVEKDQARLALFGIEPATIRSSIDWSALDLH